MSSSVTSVLRSNPDFEKLWWGQALSSLGSTMNGIALPLFVLHLSGSAAAAGATITVRLLALNVVRLPGGVFADRWDRRSVMIRVDLIKAMLWATPVLMVITGARHLWPLLVVAVMDGLVSSVYNPALGAAVRFLVPPSQIVRAVSLNQARAYAAGLLGPALGGILFMLTPWAPFAVDSATFLVCAVLTLGIAQDLGGRNPVRSGMLSEIWTGLRYVAAQPFLRIQSIWSAVINFATGAAFFGLIPILQDAGLQEGVIGLWSSLVAGAGFVGALAAPRLSNHRPYAALLTCGGLITFFTLVIALTPVVSAVIVGLVLVSAVGPALSVLLSSHVYRIVPDELLGRTQSSMTTVGSLIYPFAGLTMGALLQQFGIGVAYGVVTLCLASCVALCTPRPIRMQVGGARANVQEVTTVGA